MFLLFLIILQLIIFGYLIYKLIIYLIKNFKQNGFVKFDFKLKKTGKEHLGDSKKFETWKILNPYSDKISGQGQPSIIAPEEKLIEPIQSLNIEIPENDSLIKEYKIGSEKITNQEFVSRPKETKPIEEITNQEFVSRQKEIKPIEEIGGLIPANLEKKKQKIENLVSSLIDILVD